jgi:gamma-glutamyltranspeptidase/glutathione hydrolase
LVTADDLKAYKPLLREPLRFEYRGYELFTMPPPSMGGIALYSIMHLLTQSKAHLAPQGSASSLHFFIEASRRAYADRRAIGADPAFVGDTVAPLRAQLLDPGYYARRQPPVSAERATPSSDVKPIHEQGAPASESSETTHFSVADAQGNAVSCTTTLSAAFGAWLVVPGTGLLLSNAMGAFSPDGVNTLAPGKRMASSMTPVIVLSRGKPAIVIGSPGGDTIPNTVAQVLRNLIDYGMTIDEAIESSRVHHQYLPNEVRIEKDRAPSRDVSKALEKMGHKLVPSPILIGDANGILIEVGKQSFWGHSDTRKGGTAVAPTKPAAERTP